MHFSHKNRQSIDKQWFDLFNRNGFRSNKSIKSRIIRTLVMREAVCQRCRPWTSHAQLHLASRADSKFDECPQWTAWGASEWGKWTRSRTRYWGDIVLLDIKFFFSATRVSVPLNPLWLPSLNLTLELVRVPSHPINDSCVPRFATLSRKNAKRTHAHARACPPPFNFAWAASLSPLRRRSGRCRWRRRGKLMNGRTNSGPASICHAAVCARGRERGREGGRKSEGRFRGELQIWMSSKWWRRGDILTACMHPRVGG